MQSAHLAVYLSSRRICFYPFKKRRHNIFIQSRQVVMNNMVMINIKYLRKYSVSVHGNIVILVKF